MHIELDYTLTPDDLAEYALACRKVGPRQSLRWSPGLWGWLIILAASVTLFVIFSGQHDAPQTAPAAVPADKPSIAFQFVAPTILVAVVLLMVFRRQFVRLLAGRRFSTSPNFGAPRQATVTDDALIVEGAAFSNTLRWSHFVHFAETKSLFLLFESPLSAHMVPKRAFRSEDDAQAFRAVLKDKIVSNRIGRT